MKTERAIKSTLRHQGSPELFESPREEWSELSDNSASCRVLILGPPKEMFLSIALQIPDNKKAGG